MEKEKRDAMIFKAFSDYQRLKILSMLRLGERCACEILDELNIVQSTLSHHMKILCESGIVIGRKEGKWVYYSINKRGQKEIVELLKEVTTVSKNPIKRKSC